MNKKAHPLPYLAALALLTAALAAPAQVTVYFTNRVDTNWFAAQNWSPNQVPGIADTAVITNGTVGITASTTVGTLDLAGGTLSAPFGLTLSAGGNWTGGTLTGKVTVAAGASLMLTNSGGTLNLPGLALVNNGTVLWTAGTLRGSGSTVVTNNGTWQIVGVSDVFNNAYGGTPVFYNNSSFIVQDGPSQTVKFQSVALTNNASAATPIDVQSGTVVFEGGGYLNGAFQAEAGAQILLNQVPGNPAPFFTGPNFVCHGPGVIELQAGSLTLGFDQAGLALVGGAVTVAPTFQNNGAISNLTLNGANLTGTNTLTGTMTWFAGSLSGNFTIASGASLYLSGAGYVVQYAALTNSGQIIWNGSGNWYVFNDAAANNGFINNLPGGVIQAQCNNGLEYDGPIVAGFDNQGLFTKTMSTNTTFVEMAFTNTGTVSVQSGQLNFEYAAGNYGGTLQAANGTALRFYSGGTVSGSFTAGYGADIGFDGGTFTQTATASFGGAGTVEVNGGTFTFPSVPTPNLQLNSGTINLPPGYEGGFITNLTINGVTLSGTNVVTGVFNLAANANSQGGVNGPLVIASGGVVNCNGGNISGGVTIQPGGTLNITGPNSLYVNNITNQGTINWTGGYVELTSGGFYNQAGAVFNIECDNSLENYYNSEFLYNDGLMQKSVTTGPSYIYVELTNNGVVVAQSGTLYFDNYYYYSAPAALGGSFLAGNGATIFMANGGSLTGNFTAAAGGTINLGEGAFTPGPGLVFNGPGQNLFSGGTILLTNSTIPNLQFAGGDVILTPGFQGGTITNLVLNGASIEGTNLVTGTLDLSGNVDGPLTVASNAVLNLGGSISSPLTLLSGATMNWSNGTLSVPLTIPTNTVVNLIGPGYLYFDASVTNYGTVNWSGGEIELYSYYYYYYYGAFYNQAGANFNILTNLDGYGEGTFINAGTVLQSPMNGTTYLEWYVNNTGLFDVQAGTVDIEEGVQNSNLGGTYVAEAGATLNFGYGGYLTGEFTAEGGGTMDFSGGIFTNTTSTVFDGVGTYNLNGGTMNLLYDFPPNLQLISGAINPGPYYQGGSIQNLTLNGLSIAGTNTVTGILNVTGSVNGPLVVANNATLNVNGNITAPILLQPGATFNWTGQYEEMDGPVTVEAGAVWNIAQSNTIYWYSVLTNYGTVNWIGGNMGFYNYYYYGYSGAIYNLPGGNFNILSDSSMYNYYGLAFMENDGTLRKIGTTGTSDIEVLFTNTAAIDAENGTMQFTTTFQQTGGTWDFGISAAGSNGVIGFNNPAPFPATLNVATNAGYVPGLSNIFTLVTYTSSTGTIGATNLPADGAQWQLNVGSSSVTLTATNLAVPVVSITNPTNTEVFTGPSSVTVSAGATDANATISSVQFYLGPTLLGTAQLQGQSYTYTWNSPPPGSYSIVAVATDVNGGLAVSAPVNITIFNSGLHSVSYTWNGSASSDWFTAANWTPNGVPGALDNVIINNNTTVALSHATSVNNVLLTSGTIGGTGALTVTNTMTCTGGNVTNTLVISSTATLVVNAAATLGVSGATLVNLGTVQWKSGSIVGNPVTIITNGLGALWLMQSNNVLSLGATTFPTNGLFVNNGTVRKMPAVGTTSLNSLDFVNNGTVDAATGTIAFDSGGTLAGTYNTATNAYIRFGNGPFAFASPPSVTGLGTTELTGGTLTMSLDIAPKLQLFGGTVFLGANFQNAGAITNLTIAGATLAGTNNIVTGTLNCASGFLGNGSGGVLTVASSGILVVGVSNNYSSVYFQNLSVSNAGEVLWQGGYIQANNSAITNYNLWLIQGGYSMTGGPFVNNNLIEQTSSGTTYIYNQPFINNGTVEVQAGTLHLNGGGTFAGAYDAGVGAIISFSGGSNTLVGLPNFSGLGAYQFGGGTLLMTNDIDPALQLVGGTVVLGPAFQNNGAINNLVLAGATLAGTNTVTGSLTVTGGEITGPLTVGSNATVTFNPGTFYLAGTATITNYGSVFCTSNTEEFDTEVSSASIVNNGLWLDQGTSDFYGTVLAVFMNNGIYRKEGGTGSSYIEILLDNNGLFDVESGYAYLYEGGVLGGTFETAAPGVLILENGIFTFSTPPANFVGPGAVEVETTITLNNDVIPTLPLNGGTVLLGPNFQRNGAITNLTLNGATLGGTNTVSGTLNLGAGSQVNGPLTVLTNALLTVSGAGSVTFDSTATLVNQGVVDWTGGAIVTYPGTVISNYGLWLTETDNSLENYYYYYYYYNYYSSTNTHFYNSGTFAKTTTSGTTSFEGIAFLNSGTLDLESGTANFSYVNTYDTNTVPYAQTGATLKFGVSAPNLSGHLLLSTNVSLDGTLDLNPLNGYTPALGDEIPVITYGAGSQTAFASLMLPPLNGMTWDVESGTAGVALRVVPLVATASHSSIAGTVMDANNNPITGITVYATETGAPNLIVNGSFESPALSGSGYTPFPSGSTNVPGWTVLGPSNDTICIHYNGFLGPAEDGAQYFDPTGTTGGAAISQTFPTVAGTTYELVFYHGSYAHDSLSSVLGVSIDTNYYTYGETDGTGGNLDWRRVQLLFTASSNQTTLTFSDLTGFDANDNFVDNVQVIPPGVGTLLEAATDADGNYQITVPNGAYMVGVDGLPVAGYNNVAPQATTVNGNNPPVNFTTTALSGGQYFTVTTAVNPATLGSASGGGSGFLLGTPVTVSVTQNANPLPYFFAGWTENGVLESTNLNYAFSAYRNRILVANFALPGLVIVASNNPPSDGVVSGTGIYTYNSTNVLTAFAYTGYRFVNWTEGGVFVSTNNPLNTLVLTNHLLVANYGDANPSHVVTVASQPPGLTTGHGAGAYTNGQTAIISAPAALTNSGTFYVFQGFTLSGAPVSSTAAFSKSFSTFDPTNLPYVANYQAFGLTPRVVNVGGNYANPVPATTGFLVTFQFDRSMSSSTAPLVVLTNPAPGAVQATVGLNGRWSTTLVSNDTYQTPGITFGNGMDGNVMVFISRVQDVYGHALSPPTNVLNVVVHSTPPPPPAIVITSPANGSTLGSGQLLTLHGTVTSTNTLTELDLYANGALLGALSAPGSGPFSFTDSTALSGGSYALTAIAIDAAGLRGTSMVTHITVNSPGSTLIDFESLATSTGPVSGTALSNYLAGFGVKVTNVTSGTTLAAVSDTNFLGGAAVRAFSGDNLLAQTGANGAVSYTLLFAQPYASVSWVRTALLAGTTGASLPAWRAHIFDSSGNELGATGESALGSFTNIPAAHFTLLGSTTPNIASIRFDGNNQGISPLSTLPLDDLQISTIPVNTTLAVTLGNSGTTVAPANVTLTANVTDSVGAVTQVSFYSGSNLLGSVSPNLAAASAGTFSLTLNNVAAGNYSFTAVAQDSLGSVSGSSPLLVVVTAVPGLSVVNFDTLNTANGAVTGAAVSNYLAGFGVALSNVTVGTAMEVETGGLVAGNGGAAASSSPNYFTQAGLNTPVSFTLGFHQPLQTFGFTRIQLLAGAGGVSHPQWQATLLDASGAVIGSAGEALIMSSTNIPARSFQLSAPGNDSIAKVRFDSDSQGTAAFSAVLLDDLILDGVAVTPQLSVSMTTSVPGNGSVSAGTPITLSAGVMDSLSASYSVNFYSGPNLVGSVGSSPYNYVWNNVLAGTYTLRAQVTDSSGVTAYSVPIAINVTTGGNSRLVNFDSLNAAHGAVSGATLSNYLAGFGITVSNNITSGTALSVENQAVIAGGSALVASSPSNIVTQTGSSGPVSYTVNFAALLTNFGFTRPELLANPFVSHPAWQATAYDATGVALGQVGEGLIGSYTNVGAQSFTLSGPGIASVQFASQGSGLTTFNAQVADDFVLTTNAAGISFPPAVAITSPVAGLQVTSPVSLNITAAAVDSAGITSVAFYANGGLIGTSTSSPYSAQLANPGAGGYALTAVALDNNGLTRTSPPVNITVLPSAFVFAISQQPAGATGQSGSSVTFSVGTSGTGAVTYQWFFQAPGSSQPTPLTGQTLSTLTVFPVGTQNAGQYTVHVTSGTTTLTSTVAELEVAQPPTITLQPLSQTVPIGNNVTLLVQAGGTGPFTWQWRLNGTDIAGATNSIYSILAAQPLNSGSYQVVVGNSSAFVPSTPAAVTVQFGNGTVETADNFSNRISINPLLGPVFGNNVNATSEPGEPLHDGKPGGKSIWYSWTASFTGVISLTTEGSDFDTLLAVYTGTNVANLTPVAADDDSGGYFTSLVTFNVTAGTTYQIAVDGFQGAAGNVVLGMPSGTGYRVLNPSSGNSVPVIAANGQPTNQLVQAGAKVTLSVRATNTTPLTYQWYFQGAPVGVAGTGSSLVISNFQAGSVGLYYVLVANTVGSVQSQTASIQIATPNQQGSGGSSQDKFGNSVDLAGTAPSQAAVRVPESGGGDSRGYSVSQVFSTVGATKEVGEPNHCGQSGGASQWFIYTAPTNGTLNVNTAGSSFNTIVAVYTSAVAEPGFADLVPQGCGFTTNFQTQGQPNVVIPGVVKNTRFYIAVDGNQGASGTVQLHIGLGQAPALLSPPVNQFAVAGNNATFSVTAVGSTNFSYQWLFNGVNIAKATNSSLTIVNTQTNNIGSYTVIVSNVVGVVTSAVPATLTLQTFPVITAGPTNETVFLGKPAELGVTVVGVNSKADPLVFQWFSTNTNGISPVSKATSALLSFPLAQYSNNGGYFVIVTNDFGAATSSVVTLTVLDTNAPLVAFALPQDKFSTNGNMVTVTGTASDKYVPVTSVQVQVNGGAPQTALGTTKWTNVVGLVPGTNIITAQATDLAGNVSKAATNHIIYLASSLLTVQTDGLGKVASKTGATNGATLIIGRNYTITAAGVSNNLFQSWSSGASVATLTNRPDGSNLTFLMYTNLILQANFVTNPFTGLAGTYTGLFYPTNGDSITEAGSGFISATISSNSAGTFTAKVLAGGSSNSFSGAFDLTGAAQTNLVRHGKPTLNITLNLDTNPADALLSGLVTVSGSGSSAAIHADRAVFNAALNPATDYAGKFTLALPPSDTAPGGSPDGYSYASLTNSLSGVSTMGGALADGTAFIWSAPIGPAGNIPIYLSLYSGGGNLMGWIYITNQPPQNVATNSWISWIKPAVSRTLYPAGFTNLVLSGIVGSPYSNTTPAGVPILNLANGTLALSNGNLAGGFLIYTNIGTNLASHNMLTYLGGSTTNFLSISIATNTGIVTITNRATGSRTNTVGHGVVLQNQTNALGAFPGTNETGSFILH